MRGAGVDRRTVLAGAAGFAGVSAGLVAIGVARRREPDVADPEAFLDRVLGQPGAVPDVRPGPVEHGRFRSTARLGATVPWVLIRPPGRHRRLPLVVALHGHGGTVAQLLEPRWDLPRFLAAAVADGVPPFAIAAVNGGDTFWHRRPSGEDAGAMVTREFLPMLGGRTRDLRGAPIGLLGWSMGGYGALRIAGLLGADRVAAVVANSPGLYLDPAQAHPDGFADPAEYRRYSIMERQRDLDGVSVRIDVGSSDPFAPAVRAYVDGFADGADLTASFEPGTHTLGYSLRLLPAELAFLGTHLAARS